MLSKYFLVKTFASILPYSLPGNLQAYQPEYLQWFLIISLSKHLPQYCHTSLPGNLQAYKPEYIHVQRVSLSEHLPVYCHKSLPGNLQDYQPECIQCFPTGCQNVCLCTFLPWNLQACQSEYMQCFPIDFVKTVVPILSCLGTCKPINQITYNAFQEFLLSNCLLLYKHTFLSGNLQAYQPE